MARSIKDARMNTRTSRLKLAQKDLYYYGTIGEGLSIGYRRTKKGNGTWQLRVRDGAKYRKYALGDADDYCDADNKDVLTFNQAQTKARELANELQQTNRDKPVTVAVAAEHYMDWFRDNRKSVKDTQSVIDTHILPPLGKKLVSELQVRELRAWLNELATTPPRRRAAKFAKQPNYSEKPLTENQKRARKATANRILTVLKAILNKAFEDELVADDVVWRKVKPFPKADEPVIRFLTEAETIRLINACDTGFRPMVKAALFTGARYGELTKLQTTDFNSDTKQLFIQPSKGGRARYIPLSTEGLSFFAEVARGKSGADLLLTHSDNSVWGRSHQTRPMKAACKIAKIEPAISFHDLRHTYASLLAQAGADLLTISKLLGHADTRITSRHYAHLCDKTLANAVESLLPGFGHEPDSKIVDLNTPRSQNEQQGKDHG